tara:strand:+ start:12006 stop:12203 length:198 start_codon:yes stop_codon:yes gene_type:complete
LLASPQAYGLAYSGAGLVGRQTSFPGDLGQDSSNHNGLCQWKSHKIALRESKGLFQRQTGILDAN